MAVTSLQESRQIRVCNSIGQHDCNLWKEYHTITLTSSKLFSILLANKTSFVSSLSHTIDPQLESLAYNTTWQVI